VASCFVIIVSRINAFDGAFCPIAHASDEGEPRQQSKSETNQNKKRNRDKRINGHTRNFLNPNTSHDFFANTFQCRLGFFDDVNNDKQWQQEKNAADNGVDKVGFKRFHFENFKL